MVNSLISSYYRYITYRYDTVLAARTYCSFYVDQEFDLGELLGFIQSTESINTSHPLFSPLLPGPGQSDGGNFGHHIGPPAGHIPAVRVLREVGLQATHCYERDPAPSVRGSFAFMTLY
jgi:hypothetical protein